MQDMTLLREALPYIQKYKDAIFVIKVGGRLVEDPLSLRTLAQDLTLLHSVGIRVVVIHGGGDQATQLLRDLHHESRFVNGRRVTDEKSLEAAKMVYGGKVNLEILSALRSFGALAVGLSGVDADLVVAQKRPVVQVLNRETGLEEAVDYGYVGDIVSVNVGVLRQLLSGGYIPVIACLGADREGNIFNINADTVAGSIAAALQAERFINVTDVRGLYRDRNDERSFISYLDVEEAEALLKSGGVQKGMIPKLQSCIQAIRGGAKRVSLINGADPTALLAEVFTNAGHGTMIVGAAEKARYESEIVSRE